MGIEQKGLNFLPEPPAETSVSKRPLVPLLDTQEMIDNMPEGRWQIPEEPYTTFERIREDNLDFMKESKRKRFQARCRELVSDWIPFFDRAERGYKINIRVIEEGVFTPDLDSLRSFSYLYRVFKPKFKENENLGFQEAVTSVRRAFLHLLTKEQMEELGHKRPEEISDEDVENARYLLDSMAADVLINPF